MISGDAINRSTVPKALSRTFGECVSSYSLPIEERYEHFWSLANRYAPARPLRIWSQHHGIEGLLALFEIKFARLGDESTKQTRRVCQSRHKSHELSDVCCK